MELGVPQREKQLERGSWRHPNRKSIRGRKVILSALDLLDGTPILDIKPLDHFSQEELDLMFP